MTRSNITLNGIILKRINYKEADRILTVYTDKLGKISVIAKGIRKLTSKKRGHLELLNNTKLELVEHKGWFIVTQAELIETFSAIKADYNKTKWAYYILESFDKLIPEQEENETLYKFLLKTLLTFNNTNINSKHLINAYNLKLIKMLGFYSDSTDFTHNSKLKAYLEKIISTRYENVFDIKAEDETINEAHSIISLKTEELAEKAIKSLKGITN